MIVAACTLDLLIPHAQSLKDKRAVVKSILARVQVRFNVAAAEVGRQDAHRFAVLGLAVVGNDGQAARQALEHVVRFIEENFPTEVLHASYEIR